MTVPLLVFVLFNRIGRGAAGAMLGSVMTFSIGVLLWAVPLVIASGGPSALRAGRSRSRRAKISPACRCSPSTPTRGVLASALYRHVRAALALAGARLDRPRARRGRRRRAARPQSPRPAGHRARIRARTRCSTSSFRTRVRALRAAADPGRRLPRRVRPRAAASAARWTLATRQSSWSRRSRRSCRCRVAYAREPSPAYQGLAELQRRVAQGGVRAGSRGTSRSRWRFGARTCRWRSCPFSRATNGS